MSVQPQSVSLPASDAQDTCPFHPDISELALLAIAHGCPETLLDDTPLVLARRTIRGAEDDNTICITLPCPATGLTVLHDWSTARYGVMERIFLKAELGKRGPVGKIKATLFSDGCWYFYDFSIGDLDLSIQDSQTRTERRDDSQRLRGRGIGGHLLQCLEDLARYCGATRMYGRCELLTPWEDLGLTDVIEAMPSSSRYPECFNTHFHSTGDVPPSPEGIDGYTQFSILLLDRLNSFIESCGDPCQRKTAEDDRKRVRFYLSRGFRFSGVESTPKIKYREPEIEKMLCEG